MKKLILATLLSATAVAPAFAVNWEKVVVSGDMTVYADKSTVTRNGGRTRMWSLFDFEAQQAQAGLKPYFSSIELDEYDCAERKYRSLQFTTFLGGMRKGDVGNHITNPNPTWGYADPDSIGEAMLIAACRK